MLQPFERVRTSRLFCGALLETLMIFACGAAMATAAPSAGAPAANPLPSEPGFVGPEDGQWTMAPKNFANTRYSGLDQVKGDNVKNLRVAWTFSTGVDRGQEAAPI